MKKERKLGGALKAIVMLGLVALIIFCFSYSFSCLETGRGREELEQLEVAIRRSAVACYATEGIYPPDIAYLEDNYGVQIDREQYAVHYEVFASNMMPDITVLEYES